MAVTIHPDDVIDHGVIEAYINRYVDAIRELNFVKAAFADVSNGLTLYTVYNGRLDEVGPRLYEVEGCIIDQWPDVPVVFRVVNASRPGTWPSPMTAHQIFVRE